MRLEFEFAYDISWLLTLGKSLSLPNYDSLRPQNEKYKLDGVYELDCDAKESFCAL